MGWTSSVSIFVFLMELAIHSSGICISDVFGVVLDCSAVAEGGIERVSAGRERGRVPPCKKVRSPLSNTSSTMYVDHCAKYISYIHECNNYRFKYITAASTCRNCTSHSLQKSIVQNSFFSLLQHLQTETYFFNDCLCIVNRSFHWKMKIKEKASWIKLSTQHSSDQQCTTE